MEKAEILDAIRRCAEENGGVAVGRERFEAMTGIAEWRWSGRYWVRWSEAVAEAGYEPGTMNTRIPDEAVLGALAELVRVLGHYPVAAELTMKRRADPTFPSPNVFQRFGSKAEVAARLVEFCGDDPTLATVAALARPVAESARERPSTEAIDGHVMSPGQVYLVKSGRHYKIGRTNSVGRRGYELAIQLPDPLDVVHVIETDDSVGIERYWHQRFATKRANGEWFALTKADVAAFKRRRQFM